MLGVDEKEEEVEREELVAFGEAEEVELLGEGDAECCAVARESDSSAR